MFAKIGFKGKEFLFTSCGSTRPDWAMQTWDLEDVVRDRWWQISEGDVVVDVGAAYGSYTLTALALGAARVVAFEPGKDMLFDLCTNLMINGWHDRCLLVNALAGASHGVSREYCPTSHSSHRSMGESEERLVFTVDEVVGRYAPDSVDWIKIDVEGAEVGVVEGATRVLQRYKPRVLIENHEEFVPGVRGRVAALLSPLGYAEENEDRGGNENWSLWTSA